jgi:hypothetical protein
MFQQYGVDLRRGQKTLNPALQVRPQLSLKLGFVDQGELPDKRKDCIIGYRGPLKHSAIDLPVQLIQKRGGQSALFFRVGVWIAGLVFCPVKRLFEWPILFVVRVFGIKSGII